MSKLVCISDHHTYHRQINLPAGDVLICAGDITSQGEISTILDFNEWLGEQTQFKHRIVVFGNHELEWSKKSVNDIQSIFTNAHYLQDSAIVLDGIKYYGSPYSSWFYDWEYNLPRWDQQNGYAGARAKWGAIPDDTNVLIVHGPAYGILDECPDGRKVGCPILLERINQLKELKVVQTGHIHHSRGQEIHNGVQFVNACICTEQYRAINKPITFEL